MEENKKKYKEELESKKREALNKSSCPFFSAKVALK